MLKRNVDEAADRRAEEARKYEAAQLVALCNALLAARSTGMTCEGFKPSDEEGVF